MAKAQRKGATKLVAKANKPKAIHPVTGTTTVRKGV